MARGHENGGILLGRAETHENTTTFWVDGFRPVRPSYPCGGGCVGIYRSQTRAQLALDASDVNVFGQCFQSGDALFLMLAPALSRAALFSRADGELKCIREFALPAIGPTRSTMQQGPAASDIQTPVAQVLAKLRTVLNRRSWYAAALISMLFFGVAASGLIAFFPRARAHNVSPPNFVDLKIQPAGSTLRLVWDPNSLPLRGAARVVLHVQDGSYLSDKDLAIAEVRSGSITYEPRSDEVIFRMDAYSAPPNATGSVRVINYPRRPATRPGTAPNLNRPAASAPSAPSVPPAPVPAKAVAPPQISRVPPKLIDQIPEDPSVTKVWLGMSLRPVTRDVALAFHLPQTYGLLISRVDAWSPAGTCGLESGDIILALNAQRIADTQDLQLKIRQKTPGKAATLAVFRDGAIRQIELNTGGILSATQSAAVGHQ